MTTTRIGFRVLVKRERPHQKTRALGETEAVRAGCQVAVPNTGSRWVGRKERDLNERKVVTQPGVSGCQGREERVSTRRRDNNLCLGSCSTTNTSRLLISFISDYRDGTHPVY